VIAVLQRVTSARVDVAGQTIGAINAGLMVLVCAEPDDTEAVAERLLDKLLKLRVFADEAGKMNRNLAEVQGGLLLVSQFTLAADLSRGNRPGFSNAAPPALARQLFEHLVSRANQLHARVASGAFGADMQVHLINDGPVTIPLTVRH
jgi:D-aminoacyl-tRNA deacylase